MKKTYMIPCTVVADVKIANAILTGSIKVDVDPTKETDQNLVNEAGGWDDMW